VVLMEACLPATKFFPSFLSFFNPTPNQPNPTLAECRGGHHPTKVLGVIRSIRLGNTKKKECAMTSHSLRGKAPLVLPPEKGSFPLDREQECSELGLIYRTCLRDNNNSSSTVCRSKARDYFECRMERGLMKREPWDKLGLGDDPNETAATVVDHRTKQETGWVAGARFRQQRQTTHE